MRFVKGTSAPDRGGRSKKLNVPKVLGTMIIFMCAMLSPEAYLKELARVTLVIRCPFFTNGECTKIERVEEWQAVGAFDAVDVPMDDILSAHPSRLVSQGS